jgi:hypothetical protein
LADWNTPPLQDPLDIQLWTILKLS